MCVQRQARVDEFFAADAVEVAIDHAIALMQVATLEQHCAGTEVEQGRGGLFCVFAVADLPADQQFCFRRIGGDQRGQRDQALTHGLQCAVFQQACPTGGDHHRVQYHVWRAVLFECISDGMDHFGVGQHPQLHRVDVEVVEAGIQLRAQELDGWHVHGDDAAGVLRGQCSNRGKAMHAVCGEGLEVSLDAGATAGVGAGDGEGGNGSGRAHRLIVPWSRRGR